MKDYNKGTYEYTLKGLKHNQAILIRDNDTGEVNEVTVSTPKQTGSTKYGETMSFHKIYDTTLEYLKLKLTDIEIRVVMTLVTRAAPITNSLDPLNDDLTYRELANELSISIGKVKPILEKLFKLGVYGRFEVTEKALGYRKYWLLNPVVATKSVVIKDDVQGLFANTELTIAVLALEKAKAKD